MDVMTTGYLQVVGDAAPSRPRTFLKVSNCELFIVVDGMMMRPERRNCVTTSRTPFCPETLAKALKAAAMLDSVIYVVRVYFDPQVGAMRLSVKSRDEPLRLLGFADVQFLKGSGWTKITQGEWYLEPALLD